MSETWSIMLRTFLDFSLLLVIVRLLGNKQLGQLNVFTYITGIVIGNMAGEMIIHRDVKIIDGIIGMTLWGIMAFLIEIIALNNTKARVLLDGEPVIVIKKGKIDYNKLKKLRLNIDDLTMFLRTNHVFSILDIDYAILESNGELSILKKQSKDLATKEELNIKTSIRQYIPTEIITNGNIVEKNLQEFDLSHNWLIDMLHKQNIYSVSDVLYAELQENGQLYIQRK